MNLKQIKEAANANETRTIRHNYSEEELTALKETFFENDLKLNDKQQELDEIKESFKVAMKPLKESAQDLRKKIRNRFIDTDMQVYSVANHDSGRMEYYHTETGELLDFRKLQPQERQVRMKVASE